MQPINSDVLPLSAGDSLHGLAGTTAVIRYTLFGILVTGDTARPGILAQGVLTAADVSLYVVPPDSSAFMALLLLTNTSAAPVTGVKLGLNGTSATAANQILPGVTIPANGSVTLTVTGWKTTDVAGNTLATGTQAFDAVIAAVTTPLALGTAGTSLVASHRDHTHQSPGGIASIVAPVAVVEVEKQVVGASLPAGFMQAGTTFRVTAAGMLTTASSPGNVVFKVRIGTTTLTGNIAVTLTAAANAAVTGGAAFYLSFLVTVRTAGANGTVLGQGVAYGDDAAAGAFTALNVIAITANAVAVDTTAIKIIELTAVTGVSTASMAIEAATIEVVKL